MRYSTCGWPGWGWGKFWFPRFKNTWEKKASYSTMTSCIWRKVWPHINLMLLKWLKCYSLERGRSFSLYTFFNETFTIKLCLYSNGCLRTSTKSPRKRWQQSIRTNLYKTASSSERGTEKVVKWTSVINHVHGIHTHDDPLFPNCEHSDVISREEVVEARSDFLFYSLKIYELYF